MINKSNTYTGEREFKDIDELKVPYVNMDITKEYTELENKDFQTSPQGLVGGEPARIQQAIQSIKLTLD